MLAIDPSRRLTAQQALQSPWFDHTNKVVGGGGEPVYRAAGQGTKLDAAAIAAMYREQDVTIGESPTYRGVPHRAPPPLMLQHALYCETFHLPAEAPAPASPLTSPSAPP